MKSRRSWSVCSEARGTLRDDRPAQGRRAAERFFDHLAAQESAVRDYRRLPFAYSDRRRQQVGCFPDPVATQDIGRRRAGSHCRRW